MGSKPGEQLALEKALDTVENSDEFSKEEKAILKKIVRFWIGLETFGTIASWLKNGLVWLGVMVGLFIAFRGWLAEWLIGLTGGSR